MELHKYLIFTQRQLIVPECSSYSLKAYSSGVRLWIYVLTHKHMYMPCNREKYMCYLFATHKEKNTFEINICICGYSEKG